MPAKSPGIAETEDSENIAVPGKFWEAEKACLYDRSALIGKTNPGSLSQSYR